MMADELLSFSWCLFFWAFTLDFVRPDVDETAGLLPRGSFETIAYDWVWEFG